MMYMATGFLLYAGAEFAQSVIVLVNTLLK